MRIWIIEDDRDIRDTLTDCLEAEGHTITSFADGSIALGQLANSPIGDRPDIILLDMLMPGMPGSAFLDALSREVSFDSIPVLITSGASLFKDCWPRAKMFLRKPFSLDALLDAVMNVVMPRLQS